uniref:G-protein coupled receptors family 1 profile domain-containing protein n=1 Tax=Branchiostoma floridae TaxID=7739 RepID=C3ZAN9_BRAFL|eukprot:XP_002594431.1 hypothetical protein BRAFLDRAFT_72183 [Branchiostoma floridae]
MFNNSSALSSVLDKTTGQFERKIPCILSNLRNNISYDEAEEACSMYTDFSDLGTGITVILLLTGLHIIVSNAVVLWGIARTPELHKQVYFFMANLAMTDLLAGVGLLARCGLVDQVGLTRLYFIMNSSNFIMYTQTMSASALCLLSVSCYVAIRHPILFYTRASSAKHDAGVAIVSSWLVLSLFSFIPSMGWNCLDMPISKCVNFNPLPYAAILVIVFILPACIMLFTNISVFIAIRKRLKRRLGQPGGQNDPEQNGAGQDQPSDEAERKFQKSMHKARTVMIQVVVAVIFWLLPLILIPVCRAAGEMCPVPSVALLMVLNSAINPIASIIRTPNLRKRIRLDAAAFHQVLVTLIRGNRVNPQVVQPPVNLQCIDSSRSGQNSNMAAGQP